MNLAIKAIPYRIACHDGAKMVWGEAIALPPPFDDCHFCVRKCDREWVIDHFETGMGFIGPVVDALENRKTRLAYMRKWQRDGKTKVRAVAWLVRYLVHLQRKQSSLLAAIREHVYPQSHGD